MEITEIRVFPKEGQDKKLKAYVTVTFDNVFVVRNIKIIEGKDHVFIAMPSKKLRFSCPKCSFKNEIESRFCNKCGVQLPLVREEDIAENADAKLQHRDIAHPITKEFREILQSRIMEAFNKEIACGRKPSVDNHPFD
ncbi:MAG: septation protein SpoVG family protein [Candidatus Omnitrophica bacterium]|nr:septation protein SpoVG family protein [Candidatus Omnitrophota bacterium]